MNIHALYPLYFSIDLPQSPFGEFASDCVTRRCQPNIRQRLLFNILSIDLPQSPFGEFASDCVTRRCQPNIRQRLLFNGRGPPGVENIIATRTTNIAVN